MCTIFAAEPYSAKFLQKRKPKPGSASEDFITFLLAGKCRVRRWTVLSKSCCVAQAAIPSCHQLKRPSCFWFAALSSGESTEMNVIARRVVAGAVGLLILQLALVASAQETVPSPASAPGYSAPPTGKIAAAESSQSQDRSDTSVSGHGATTQPGKAGGKGDPAFGGERHPLYRLTKSDTVDVNFTFSPDFNQTLTVQPDGFVALKGAGTVFVEGLTILEMQQAVAKAYHGFLHEPEVTVTNQPGASRPHPRGAFHSLHAAAHESATAAGRDSVFRSADRGLRKKIA